MQANEDKYSYINIPATQAVMKHATDPVSIAVTDSCAKSDLRPGAIELSAPTWIPIEPRFANPHNANVAIVSDRF